MKRKNYKKSITNKLNHSKNNQKSKFKFLEMNFSTTKTK